MTDSLRRRTALQAGGGAALLSWLPSLRAQSQSAAERPGWPAWEAFKAQFINEGGRVISDDAGGGQTYSEGQAYALFFALVANDRAAFDKLLRWTENNLCDGDMTARLPAWLWGKRPDGSWGVIDSNAASDADLWIAYALGEAGRLWNVRSYRALSALLATRILREETAQLPGLGLTLLPAPQGFAQGVGRWRLNPSYLPPQLLARFARISPIWAELASNQQRMLIETSPKGFAPDWLQWKAGGGWAPDSKEGSLGDYDAIRVYLWVGMLAQDAANRQTLQQHFAPMASLTQTLGYVPESVNAVTGKYTGTGPVGFSAAMLPLLSSLDSPALAVQQERIKQQPPAADAYYNQSLLLFGQGWDEQRYRFDKDGQLLPSWIKTCQK